MRKKIISSVLLTTGLAFCAAPLAFAADPEYPEHDEQVTETALTFEEVDANSDGAISDGEASADAALSANFETADADGDGQLDDAEFEAALALNDDERDSAD